MTEDGAPERRSARLARWRAAGLALAVFSVSGASAAECSKSDPTLVGHYYLRGVFEVGSELLLQANGHFDYMLAYGALDELASGCWSREGDVVTLVASKFETSMSDPMKFDRLELAVRRGGTLVRRFEAGRVGIYSR